MRVEEAPSYPISIFIAGDAREAEKLCQVQCDYVGLCVTVTPTNYIYTDGSQSGVIVGLINYPRFPAEPRELWETAEALAKLLRVGLDQESFSIQAPDKTAWFSWREENLAIAAGTRSAETNEDLAQSEGCQSGAKAHRPNSVGHLLHKRSD